MHAHTYMCLYPTNFELNKIFFSEDDSFYHFNQTLTIPGRKYMRVPNCITPVNLSESIITPLRKEQFGHWLLHLN